MQPIHLNLLISGVFFIAAYQARAFAIKQKSVPDFLLSFLLGVTGFVAFVSAVVGVIHDLHI